MANRNSTNSIEQLPWIRGGIRHAVSRSIGNPLRTLFLPYRYLTGSMRLSPNFFVLGAQKGGTTSLYAYLVQHPRVFSIIKEIHYYDYNYHHGMRWYKANFPLRSAAKGAADPLSFDVSPYYLYHPLVPARVAQDYPNTKLVALLRNPIERAYSHYQHNIKSTVESLSFPEAVHQEPERLRGEAEKMRANPRYYSYNHRYFSYVERGIYADQIARWWQHFPKENLLVLESEHFFENTPQVFQQVLDFLELESFPSPKFEVFNPGMSSSKRIDPAIYAELQAYYAPHNQRLYDMLGTTFRW